MNAPNEKYIVLITGGSGAIGSNLVRFCLEHNLQVHLLLRPNYNSHRLEPILNRVQTHHHDLQDAQTLSDLLESIKPDWIFHLATHGAYSWQNDLTQIMQTNFQGTVNLVQAAINARVKVMINTGTSSEYGYKDHAPLESEIIQPNSHYAISKAAATHYCHYAATHLAQNLFIPTLRLYNVYGPWEDSRRLVPNVLRSALRGYLPPLAQADIARDYIHVEDVCRAYLMIAQHFSSQIESREINANDPAPIYNIGTGTQTTLKQFINLVLELLNLDLQPEWGTAEGRRWDTSIWFSNPAKIQKEIGWQSQISLRSGLNQMIDWYRSHPI